VEAFLLLGEAGRMSTIRKYAFALALAVAVIYAYAPLSLKGAAKLQWFDDVSVIINKALAPSKREVGVPPVDPIAAANVDEDLDYLIAQRNKTAEGWRLFLAAHPDGPHAQFARVELGELVPREKPPAPEAAQASNVGSLDAKTPSEATSPGPPSSGSEVARLTPDEICRRDEDRLEQLSNRPISEEAARFANELGCERLRPQVLALARSTALTPPTQGVAPPTPSCHSRRWRVTAHPTSLSAPSRMFQRRGFANVCAFESACIRTPTASLAFRHGRLWRRNVFPSSYGTYGWGPRAFASFNRSWNHDHESQYEAENGAAFVRRHPQKGQYQQYYW
jgi:hypothetical protein